MFGREMIDGASLQSSAGNVFSGEMLLYFTGSRSAVVENYRSILFFTDSELMIQGKKNRLEILGQHLTIEYYDKELLKVRGKLQSVNFIPDGAGRKG